MKLRERNHAARSSQQDGKGQEQHSTMNNTQEQKLIKANGERSRAKTEQEPRSRPTSGSRTSAAQGTKATTKTRKTHGTPTHFAYTEGGSDACQASSGHTQMASGGPAATGQGLMQVYIPYVPTVMHQSIAALWHPKPV